MDGCPESRVPDGWVSGISPRNLAGISRNLASGISRIPMDGCPEPLGPMDGGNGWVSGISGSRWMGVRNLASESRRGISPESRGISRPESRGSRWMGVRNLFRNLSESLGISREVAPGPGVEPAQELAAHAARDHVVEGCGVQRDQLASRHGHGGLEIIGLTSG